MFKAHYDVIWKIYMNRNQTEAGKSAWDQIKRVKQI